MHLGRTNPSVIIELIRVAKIFDGELEKYEWSKLDKFSPSVIIPSETLALPFRLAGRGPMARRKMKPHFLQVEEWGFYFEGLQEGGRKEGYERK